MGNKLTVSELMGAIENCKREAIRRREDGGDAAFARLENRLDEAKDELSACISADPAFAQFEVEAPRVRG